MNDTDRFAMLLIDSERMVENPPMYAFTLGDNGFHVQRFNHAP